MSSQTIITLTGDEKSAYEAFKKVIEQAAKLETKVDKVSEKAKKVKNNFDFAQQGKDAFMGMATSIVSVTGAIGVLHTGLQGVRAEYERINEVARDQLTKAQGLAAAQQDASKNLAGVPLEEQRRIYGEVIPRISVETNFPNQEILTRAFGSAASVVGPDRAASIVETAAGLTNLNPEQLQQTTSALADVVKFSGVKDAKEAMAMILSAGSVARPENIQALSQAIARSSSAGVIATAETQDALAATKDQAALLAMLSEIDPSGNSAGTAVATLTAQMAELFSDLGMEERNKKAIDLAEKRERAEEDLLRAQIQLEQRQKKAEQIDDPNTPQAKATLLSVDTTRSEMARLARSIAETDKEIAQLAAIDEMRKSDPGNTTGRLFAVSQNEEARSFLLKNLRGEEIYKPLFTGLITQGSQQQQNLQNALSAVTSEVKAFADAMKTQTITPQQRVAVDLNRSEALQTAESLADPQLELAASIKKIREDAERNTTLPLSFAKMMANAIEAPFRSFVPLGTPQEEAQYTIDRLNDLIQQTQPLIGQRSANDQRQVEMLKQQMEIVANLARLSAEMRENTEEVRKNNAIMQQDIEGNTTGTIQAQAEKRK